MNLEIIIVKRNLKYKLANEFNKMKGATASSKCRSNYKEIFFFATFLFSEI